MTSETWNELVDFETALLVVVRSTLQSSAPARGRASRLDDAHPPWVGTPVAAASHRGAAISQDMALLLPSGSVEAGVSSQPRPVYFSPSPLNSQRGLALLISMKRRMTRAGMVTRR
jgi:hypothetical protein